MPFFPAEGHDDLHHCGLVVYNDDLSHSRRAENISELRKGKQKREILTEGWMLASEIMAVERIRTELNQGCE